MSHRELPDRPNLEQYKKQAKDLVRDSALGLPEALSRINRHHPRCHQPATRTDAQFVIAREHGFESWPKFARYVGTINLIRSTDVLADPVSAFLEFACVPRHAGHGSGTVEHADTILARYPEVARANIYTAAVLADETTVRAFLSADRQSATRPGGPYNWDALTHLCFSRYLRVDKSRWQAFVAAARALLEAGASADTGWVETIDQPNPRQVIESALYGVAGIAGHPDLTRLLLEHGADPNDEETPYHVPEGYDNTVMAILLDSGKLNSGSLAWMLCRKTDWHDDEGIQLLLEHDADPNRMTPFGDSALHHALRRDNGLSLIEMLLDHGADPALRSHRDQKTAAALAAQRGRGDVLRLFERRGLDVKLEGVDQLIAACAKADGEGISLLLANDPDLRSQLIAKDGSLLGEFAGNNNVDGLRCLLELGATPASRYEGDLYFDIAKDSTALHVAAWRGWPDAVKFLISSGIPVNAVDGKGRTALALAVKACVDSYWTYRRSPESAKALLDAGATTTGVKQPTGYTELDELLRLHSG